MRGQHRAVHEVRLVLGQHPLQAQDERVVTPPLHRRLGRGRRRARPAPRSARRGVRCPRPGRSPASSPSSTSGSRANSSARRRSSPDTGAVSTTELLSATIGRSLQGERTGRAVAAAETGPALISRVRPSYSPLSRVQSGERAESIRNSRRPPIVAHETACLPPLGRMRRLALTLALAAALLRGLQLRRARRVRLHRGLQEARRGARGAGRPLPRAERAAGRRRGRLQEAHRRAPRPPGGGERLGVLVRALPLRVPVLPEAGRQARQARGLPRASTPRTTEGDAADFLDEYPLPFPSYEDPDGDVTPRAAGGGPARHRLLRPQG